MKGLVIWLQSVCRSTMGLYRALGKSLGVPITVPVWHCEIAPGATDIRAAVGFRKDEFSDIETIPVGEDFNMGLSVLDTHPGWNHLFCVYQNSPLFSTFTIGGNAAWGKNGKLRRGQVKAMIRLMAEDWRIGRLKCYV